MTAQDQILIALKEKLAGQTADVVGFVDELLTATEKAGEIRCTLARAGALRLQIGTEVPCELELDSAKATLRMVCARLAVLCEERGKLKGSLYGGEGVIGLLAGQNSNLAVSPNGNGWAVLFKNTPSEQCFTIRPYSGMEPAFEEARAEHRGSSASTSPRNGLPEPPKSDTIGPEQLDRHVTQFNEVRDRYEALTALLADFLKGAVKTLGIEADVKARTKDVPSFAEKVMRKKYRNPLEQMTDLSGVRIVTHTKAEANKACQFIRHNFLIDESNSRDASQQLRVGEFGYRAVHYVLQLRGGEPPPPYRVPEELRGLKAEVQVRTIPEHCWAEIGHDRLYKSAFKVPDRWKREFHTIAALLESVDEAFMRIAEALSGYEASYGGFIDQQQIDQELEILERLLPWERHNEKLAHQVARLRLSRGRWDSVISLVGQFDQPAAGAPAAPTARLLLCAGIACSKKAKETGDARHADTALDYMRRAYEADCKDAQLGGRRNVEIVVTLADALASRGLPQDADTIGARYDEAFALDPGHPRVLIGQFQYRVGQEKRDLPDTSFLKPLLQRAIRRCLDQIEVRVNIPWAYYSLGELHLLGREQYDCLNAYAKAVEYSAERFMLESALESLGRLEGAKSLQEQLPLVRQLLHLGLKARFDVELPESVKATCGGLRQPVVIVAGGCDPAIQNQMFGYEPLFEEAFRTYEGTIISGGTTDGISGVVGRIAREAGPRRITAVTYAPAVLEDNVNLDRATFEVRQAEGAGFGPAQPLQNWVDILRAGISPSVVRLIGVNGGKLAAFEYRLALALGATIGVIEESGRAADSLLRDAEWQVPRDDKQKLIRLPADAMTVWSYLRNPAQPHFDGRNRERLARQLHELWLARQKDQLSREKSTLREWDALEQDAKDSNLQQADHILVHLRQVGIAAEPGTGEEAPLVLNQHETERLARMEHGRWNLEKLEKGWTFGSPRDDKNKVHPSLRPWELLPDKVQKDNLATVAAWPELLRSVKLVLRRLQGTEPPQ